MKKLNYLFVGILFGLMLIGPAGAQDASDAQPVEEPLPQGVLSGASVPEFTEEQHGKSADEIAKELANPNTSLASLTFKNQFRWYTGDLPNGFSICSDASVRKLEGHFFFTACIPAAG